jgi:hypothetical protein
VAGRAHRNIDRPQRGDATRSIASRTLKSRQISPARGLLVPPSPARSFRSVLEGDAQFRQADADGIR